MNNSTFVVNLDLPLKERLDFEKTVNSVLSELNYIPLMFFYDLESLRKKIVCLCKKGCLHKATILHYGSSNEAVKVSKTRSYKCGKYYPKMVTTASSDLLEDLDVKYSRSLISREELKNSVCTHFLKNIENYVYYRPRSIPNSNTYYFQNLQAAYSGNNSLDVILTKDVPSNVDSRVFSTTYASLATDWLHSDTAVSEFHEKNIGMEFKGLIDENDIVTIKAGKMLIKTPLLFAEAAGVVKNVFVENGIKVVELAQNVEEIWVNLTKQLALGV